MAQYTRYIYTHPPCCNFLCVRHFGGKFDAKTAAKLRRNSAETPPTSHPATAAGSPLARRRPAAGGGSLSLPLLPLSVFFYLFRDTLQMV